MLNYLKFFMSGIVMMALVPFIAVGVGLLLLVDIGAAVWGVPDEEGPWNSFWDWLGQRVDD